MSHRMTDSEWGYFEIGVIFGAIIGGLVMGLLR